MSMFLSVVLVLMVLLGTGWLFFPETMLGWWGVETDQKQTQAQPVS